MWQRNWMWIAVVLIWLPTVTQKARAEPYSNYSSTGARTWCTPGIRCADSWKCLGDDYCKKAAPFTPCYTPRNCCDDYCKKIMPCEPRVQRGCCDDYCKKTCPVRLW